VSSTNHLAPRYAIFSIPPITSSLLGPNILLNTIFSNTLSFLTSLNVSDQVSHPWDALLTFPNLFRHFVWSNTHLLWVYFRLLPWQPCLSCSVTSTVVVYGVSCCMGTLSVIICVGTDRIVGNKHRTVGIVTRLLSGRPSSRNSIPSRSKGRFIYFIYKISGRTLARKCFLKHFIEGKGRRVGKTRKKM